MKTGRKEMICYKTNAVRDFLGFVRQIESPYKRVVDTNHPYKHTHTNTNPLFTANIIPFSPFWLKEPGPLKCQLYATGVLSL